MTITWGPVTYPTSIDLYFTASTLTDFTDEVWVNHPNMLGAAVVALEDKLGITGGTTSGLGALAFFATGLATNPMAGSSTIPTIWVDTSHILTYSYGGVDSVLAYADQTMHIGTTSVAINRGSAALTLAGITLTTPDIGTPSAGVLTSCTGLPVAGLAAGTIGELLTWDATTAAAVVAVGTATHVLTSNGVGVAPTFQAPATVGDVVGPGSAVDNTITVFDGITGKLLKDSGVVLAIAANTYSITRGTASLDIASGSVLDVNANLTVSGVSSINQNVTTTGTPSFTTVSATTVNAATLDTNVAAAALTLSATTLAAAGSDTHIDIVITPKGSAGIVIASTSAPGDTTSKLYNNGGVLYFGGVNLEDTHAAVTLNASATTAGLTLSTQELSYQVATAAQNGYLLKTDWSTFNGKQAALTLSNLTEATSSVLTITNGTAAIIGAAALTIEVDQADTSNAGYLSSTDWNTFNGKQAALTLSNLTEATSSVLTITNGTSAIIGAAALTIEVDQADTANDGYLSSTDWDTFNGKAAADQAMHIGTTSVAINRGSAALNLAGITLTTPDIGTPSAGVLTSCTGLPIVGLADGTDGELITWDAAGKATTVAVGTATHVLTSNGIGAVPTFQVAGGGGASAIDDLSDADTTSGTTNLCLGAGSVALGTNNTAVGLNCLSSSDATAYENVAVGQDALAAVTTGYQNIAIGYQAGFVFTVAHRNIAIGTDVLSTGTTNNSFVYNIAIGFQTMGGLGVRTDSNNIGIGYRALFDIAAGDHNVAIGDESLSSITTGNYNVGLGSKCGLGLTTGQLNVFLGASAGDSVSAGSYNVIIGYQAGKGGSTTGLYDNNVAIGRGAMSAVVGSKDSQDNVAIGEYSLRALTNGDYNVGIGKTAGDSITTGQDNVLVGRAAAPVITTGSSNVAVGKYALNTVATSSSDNVALGIDAGRYFNGISSDNTLIGAYAGGSSSSGAVRTGCVYIGSHAGDNATSATGELWIANTNTATPLIYGVFPNTSLTFTSTDVTATGNLTSTQYKLSALNTAPSSATDTGTLGEIRFVADALYFCWEADKWVKATLATW